MTKRKQTLFKLYVLNAVILTVIFCIFAVSLSYTLRYFMRPYYLNELHERVLENVKKREAIMAAMILTGDMNDADALISNPNFAEGAESKKLHPYSMSEYSLYGLARRCSGRLERYGWGTACEEGGTYLVEVPIRSADNTLAHLIVALKPDIAGWHPYRVAQGGIIAFIVVVLLASLVLILTVYFRYARPIKKQIDGLVEHPDAIDYDALKANLPIDECLQLTTQLERYHELAAQNQALAAVGGMSSHIAHDMRSPLSVLAMYVGIKRADADPDAEELRLAAERSMRKLNRMADDLVDYAKASKLDRQDHDMGECMRDDVVVAAKKKAQDRGIEVRYQGAERIVANVDRDKLERVVSNMVNNAIQAVSDIDGEVVVKAVGEGGALCIEVRDNGKGISPENLPHIFDRLFTRDKKGGSGLGLAYCRQVVEAHGGSIEVQSEAGRGTVFTITIPNCIV